MPIGNDSGAERGHDAEDDGEVMGWFKRTVAAVTAAPVNDAEDTAILREVRGRLQPSFLEPEKHTQFKIDVKAQNLRAWAETLQPAERAAYLKWINYFVRDCERRLEMEEERRAADQAKISRPPK